MEWLLSANVNKVIVIGNCHIVHVFLFAAAGDQHAARAGLSASAQMGIIYCETRDMSLVVRWMRDACSATVVWPTFVYCYNIYGFK